MTTELVLSGTLIESRTPEQWAQTIRSDLGQAVAGFIAAGQHLAQAKEQLGLTSYDWENWLRDEIGISASAASRLLAIGRHEFFQDQPNWVDLAIFPRHEHTMYMLTQLSSDDLNEAVTSGTIHSGLQLEDAKAIVTSYKARAAVPDIRIGDFREVLGDVRDAALVLTDPPYGDAAVPLYADLAAWAAHALAPGGSLIAYTGQATLPSVLAAMQEHLRYWWTFAIAHNGGSWSLPGKKVLTEWKPAVWFVRDRRATSDFVADMIRGSRPEKSEHGWAQGSAEAIYLIEQLTEPGQLVVDPFSGSGTVGKAALSANRKFIGADKPGMVTS